MANRPAWSFRDKYVVQSNFDFAWNGGFAASQKQKNIVALHNAIQDRFHENALEISTKSLNPLGKRMSAFVLKLDGVLLECVFQSSKVFQNGGPYLDLLQASPKDAKRDERLKTSGPLKCFRYDGMDWPLEPRSAFYDYLYCKAALATFTPEELKALDDYQWFTDIEFNPQRSINSQARSVAILKALLHDGAQQAVRDPHLWLIYHRSVASRS